MIYDKAFSLTWLVSMQNYWKKRKRSTPTGLVWNTNMAAVTSCVNALNNVVQINICGRGVGEVNKGYNKLEYDLPAQDIVVTSKSETNKCILVIVTQI